MSSAPRVSPWMAALTVASLFLMAALDYFTGQELVFSCAYLIPVSMSAWWLQRRWMIAMSIACGITALLVDEFDGYDYAHHNTEYWNAFASLLICIVTGLVLSHLKQTLFHQKKANQELRAALEKLETSTQEIRKLQNGLQTICAWTQRIKVGEEWMTPDEFLSTQLHLKLTHDISPEAFRELQKDISSAA